MKFARNYTQHYRRHIECEFCGQLTRGRIWDDKPGSVLCGSCHCELIPVDVTKKSTHHDDDDEDPIKQGFWLREQDLNLRPSG